jgi:aromatic ring-opening dioxygenase catalytic subunit (LigB family)
MVAFKEQGDPNARVRVYDAFARAGARLRDAAPDVVVLVTNEHFANFFAVVPAFYINIGDSTTGPVERWLGLDKREVPGAPDLARSILDHWYADEFDVAWGHDAVLDHGSIVPLELLGVPPNLPVIPVLVNAIVEPLPTHERCRALGESLGRRLERAEERVALVAAGGLSHWPGMAEQGRISTVWDKAVLDALEAGDRQVLWCPPEHGAEEAGPGANELRAWAIVGAAVEQVKARVLAYEAVESWATGIAVVDLLAVEQIDTVA